VTVDDLSIAETTTLSYDITAFIVSSSGGRVQKLKMQTFTTLMPSYKPEDVTQIEEKGWSEYYDEEEKEFRLRFAFTWQPERSHTCHYDVLFFGDDFDLDLYPVPIEKLYEFTMSDLKYNSEYNVAVRARNSYDERIHSREAWRTFNSLEGETTLEITAQAHHIEDLFFDVNVTWNKLKESPHKFQVDFKNIYSVNGSGIYTEFVDGVRSEFLNFFANKLNF
jgi:hypothetical protein